MIQSLTRTEQLTVWSALVYAYSASQKKSLPKVTWICFIFSQTVKNF